MTDVDAGDFVRHSARPEWGIGRVLRRAGERLDVQFQHGLVALKLSVAGAFLEPATKAEARAAGVNIESLRKGPASTASGTRRRRGVRAVAADEVEEPAEPAAGVDDE